MRSRFLLRVVEDWDRPGRPVSILLARDVVAGQSPWKPEGLHSSLLAMQF